MLNIGPRTQEWLDNSEQMTSLASGKGMFHKSLIHEIRILMGHYERYRGKPIFFTMRDYEYKGFVSLKQIYMNSVDEYDCAMKAFNSWDNWVYLLKDQYFMNGPGKTKNNWAGIAQWREEKRLSDQSMAKRTVIDLAARGNFAAAKMLYDNTIEKVGPGRPTKEKVLEKITEEAEKTQQVIADMKRIRLAVNNEKSAKDISST